MDIDKVKEDFTLKTNDLAEAHGVSAGCITNWTKEGAFPYARRVGKTSTIFYPPRTLRMTGGEIKINIAHRKYIHPIIIHDVQLHQFPYLPQLHEVLFLLLLVSYLIHLSM